MSHFSSGVLPPLPPSSQGPQYFSLRWNSHPVELISGFTGLYQSETLVDVTLAAEGRHLQAHKMLLSACSDYFQSLFSINPCQHPIVILKDVKFDDLRTIVQFMYDGTVNVSGDKLPDIMKIAETLQIKGLAGGVVSGRMDTRPPKLLSVMSQQSRGSRQLSTESLPEFIQRRDISPLDTSTESRQHSEESSTAAKRQPSPPVSPHRHFRKRFRRLSGAGSSSERGNSVDDDRSPGCQTLPHVSPIPTQLSPSRQSSSSTDPDVGATAAKKKRDLFSARSSRSGGSNKSSMSEYSRDFSFSSKQQESTGSSGQSQSINQSQDDGVPTTNASLTGTVTSGSTLTVPITITGRSLSRSQSIVEQDDNGNQQAAKRNRFLLKRQNCLEKGNEGEMDLTAPPPVSIQPPTPTDIKREMVDSPLPTVQSIPSLSSPQPSFEREPTPPIPQRAHTAHVLTKQRSAPLASCDSLDLPPLLPKPPPFSPSHPPSPHSMQHYVDYSMGTQMQGVPLLHTLHQGHHSVVHNLPSVRVIPDTSPPHSCHDSIRLEPTDPPLSDQNSSLLHPNFRSKSTESPPDQDRYDIYPESLQRRSVLPIMHPGYMTSHPVTNTTGTLSIVQTLPVEQFRHCPKAREGPALGCNYCWNTTDPNGRILRRKTKYHCPECQANLCIVPCFQAYHEEMETAKPKVSTH